MTTSSILEVFDVNEKIGITNPLAVNKNMPKFLPKNTWQFYAYSVLRNGRYIQVGIDDLVQGDIIILNSGDIVPATIRLLRSSSLTVLEDHVSGTVAPSHKQTFASRSLMPKSQQKNMLFSGSEVLEGKAKGIIVRLAQHDKQRQSTQTRANRSFEKRGIIVHTPHSVQTIKKVTTVFFDDLQQEAEVLQVIRLLYQQKHINVTFFVSNNLMNKLRAALPIETFENPAMSGITVCDVRSDAEKAKRIASANANNHITMFVHRGTGRSLVPKIAAVNMVISPHATQTAIRHADLIAGQISVTKFASILHNIK